MARFNTFNTMLDASLKKLPPRWQCENCGKIYPSYAKMINTKCHSHPKGAWAGSCYCGKEAEILGKQYESVWQFKQEREHLIARNIDTAKSPNRVLSLCPGRNFIYEVNVFSLAKKMLEEWTSKEATATRTQLRDSCHDYLSDMEDLHIYHEKYGIYESHIDNLKSLQKQINEQTFWMKLYCLFYATLILDEKYEHLLTTDAKLIAKWKSNDDWRWLSNWPNSLVLRFVHCGITVVQHGSDYSNELEEFYNSIVEILEIGALGVNGGWGSSKIPKEYGPAYNELAKRDLHDIDFWFDLYCFLRLELKPRVAHLNSLED